MRGHAAPRSGNNPADSTDEAVAGRLQFCVSMLGMSATEVAKEIGVSVSAVTKWLRSGRITRTHLVDFSFRYNINLEWLMTGIGSMRHHSKDDPTVNTVPIYPLGQIRCRNNLPTCADESLSVGRVWVQGDTARHFGIEVNCPEVDPRLRPGRHFVFLITNSASNPGRLVAICPKNSDGRLVLRVVFTLPDGSVVYGADTNRLPHFTPDDADIIGEAIMSVDSCPTFF